MAASTGGLPRWRDRLALLLWLVVPFLVYAGNHKAAGGGDSVPAALIPVVLVLDETVLLDRFAAEEHRRPVHPYWLVDTPHGTASFYPIATPLLVTPILAGPILLQQWWHPLTVEAWRDLAVGPYQSITAALIAALAVVLFRQLCRMLGFARWLSVALTALFAFGSEMMSTVSQALWQHGPGILLLLAAMALLLRLPRGRWPAALGFGLCLGLAIAVRPTNLLLAGPLWLAAVPRAPRAAVLAALAATLAGAPFGLYNLWLFGTLLGGYAGELGWHGAAQFATGLAGVLVSPGRGLLIYFPATLLAMVLLLRRPAVWRDALVPALVAGSALQVVMIAAWDMWWGGFCFGPRLLSEIQAPILLLLGLAFPAEPGPRRAAGAALALVLAFSLGVQLIGAYSQAAIRWNGAPVSVDSDNARLWQVADSPLLRGLRGPW
ncbi:MAG: hypothetical protein U1E53_25205 [Dongiaceae bacterium]